jgi:predicted neuraminidase
LTLSRSSNGIDWSPLHTVASGSNEDEYSYPALLWADDSLWVSYTVDRQTIDWQRYSAQPISAPIPQQGSKP